MEMTFMVNYKLDVIFPSARVKQYGPGQCQVFNAQTRFYLPGISNLIPLQIHRKCSKVRNVHQNLKREEKILSFHVCLLLCTF